VKRGFQEHKDDPEFQSKSKDEKLGFLFGLCAERNEDFITPLERVSDFIEGFAKDFTEDTSFRVDEIDIWIEKGFKDDFLVALLKQDVKLEEIDIVTERQDDIRYGITIRAFSKYEIPDGDFWEVKNVFRGEGKLPKISTKGKGRGWHGDPEGHSKAAKKGKQDLQDLTEDFLPKLKHSFPKEIIKEPKIILKDKVIANGNEVFAKVYGEYY